MFGAYWNYCQISDGVLYYTGLRPTENEVHSMNKTFKIVFNKARGALMVANEITGSVQKKGTKVVITTIAMAAAGTAIASGGSYQQSIADAQNKQLGNDDETISFIKTDFNKAYGLIGANNNYSLTVLGSEINLSTNGRGVVAGSNGGTVNIGNEKTKKIDLNTSGDIGILVVAADAHVALVAKDITIENTNPNTDKYPAALWVQSNDQNLALGNRRASLKIDADNLKLASHLIGLAAFSGSKTDINANLTIDAANVIDTRGNATVNINTDGKHSTTLNGDIVFETPNSPGDTQNSGELINSNVTVVLSGSDSSWTGRSYQEYKVNGKLQQLIGLEGDPSYHGNVTGFKLTAANGATWNVTGDSFVNELTLKNGGAIQAADSVTVRVGSWNGTHAVKNYISVEGMGNTLALGTGATLDSKLKIASDAELITNLGSAFTGASVSNETLTLDNNNVGARLSFVDSEKGTLSISDKFAYTGTDLTSLSTIYKGQVGLNFANATLALEDNVIIDTPVTTGTISGNKNVEIREGGSLTLTGNNKTSNINTVTLNAGATLSANNNTTVKIDTLSGTGDVTVGKLNGTNAHMSINKLDMRGGSIFVDPYYGQSTLAVTSLNNGALNTNVTAGTGALVAFGTDIASAKNAVAKLDGFDSVESLVYVGKPMALSDTGSIVIDPDAERENLGHAQAVYVANGGALVIDQAAIGSDTVFSGASVKFSNGKLGITNANVGTITLTDAGVATDTTAGVSGLSDSDITTDNPFVEATVNGNTVVNTMSAEGGLGALASTGIQAMTRRADTVLAQTIADRTSLDQELAAGTNFWVDVTGERYEADKLDNGGEFKSDMGYGAFGADFAVTQGITAGAAFQYGKGTLRSGVSSIKNSIDSYGVTAYGAMKFGEAKVVAEASYIKNENDITSSQTALNQSVDSEIYSVGVRGQHRFTAGNFQFVPSVGVRVSRLNTDAMQVGAVNIKKQEQTLVQVPIALRVNGFEQNVSGWSVAPSFKIAYVPTFGDKEISVFGADQTVIDTSPVQGDFGIRAQNGNLMVNANMMLGGGKDGTSSVGGKVGLKYVF